MLALKTCICYWNAVFFPDYIILPKTESAAHLQIVDSLIMMLVLILALLALLSQLLGLMP